MPSVLQVVRWKRTPHEMTVRHIPLPDGKKTYCHCDLPSVERLFPEGVNLSTMRLNGCARCMQAFSQAWSRAGRAGGTVDIWTPPAVPETPDAL